MSLCASALDIFVFTSVLISVSIIHIIMIIYCQTVVNAGTKRLVYFSIIELRNKCCLPYVFIMYLLSVGGSDFCIVTIKKHTGIIIIPC